MISAEHNDPPEYHVWSDKLRRQVRTNLFKRPVGLADESHDPLAILIVKSMLLTGFDAPLSGTHHRGIDDARNIARIVQQTLPNVVVA